jgi:hypothetical protein
MGTSNSSTVTRERAATLAGEIGAHHTPSAIAPLTSYYLPTYRLTDLPTYRLTDLPTYRLTDLPTYRLTDLPTYRLTDLLFTIYSGAHHTPSVIDPMIRGVMQVRIHTRPCTA